MILDVWVTLYLNSQMLYLVEVQSPTKIPTISREDDIHSIPSASHTHLPTCLHTYHIAMDAECNHFTHFHRNGSPRPSICEYRRLS